MKIDNYDAAVALTEKLKTSLPMKARPGKELSQMLKKQGKELNPDKEYEINHFFYSGDEGGIICTLESKADAKEAYAVSITHLKVDSNHPLAPEVREYQRQRTHKLFLQDHKSGFGAELLVPKSSKRRKQGSGFGK
jgi:hypothetical protein